MARSLIGNIFIYGYITIMCIVLIILVSFIWERLRYKPQTAWRHREHWEQLLNEEEPSIREDKLYACYQWQLASDKQRLNGRVIGAFFFLSALGFCIGFMVYVNQFSPDFFENNSLRTIALLSIPLIFLIGFLHAWTQYQLRSLKKTLESAKQLEIELGGALEAILLLLQTPTEDE